MKITFFVCVISCLFIAFVESAEIGSYSIPLDVTVNGKVIPAATYAIQIESNSVELLKENEVVATEPAIVLPAAGSDDTTITVVHSKKQDYVRIRIRHDNSWYIVYLPVTQHSALSTQHS